VSPGTLVVARRVSPARLVGAAAAAWVLLSAPAVVLAHGLSPSYQSPLPLAVYLVGAAATVALSFAFVLLRDLRAGEIPPGRLVRVPLPLRLFLRAIGLVGWAWVLAQGAAGGTSDAAVATLFLWVYGWVGVAAISALIGPIWEWLDPFATLYDVLAAALRAIGVRGWAPSELPSAFRIWPAVVGLGFFIWLELVAIAGIVTLTIVLAGYTVLTLALMAQFGRDAWRMSGETFTVWFRTLNRLAPFGYVAAGTRVAPIGTPAAEVAAAPELVAAEVVDVEEPDGVDPTHAVRRPFAIGLFDAEWSTPRIVLVAFGTGSIMFDGLSQTVPFATIFGAPALFPKTLLLFGFLGIITALALLVAREVSPNAIGAGLLPIAVGYLVAHYLTYLVYDGQRIVIAVSDPLQQGSDLFGTAFYQVTTFLPPGLVWTIQLASVVGGHMLGAWAGHVSASRDAEARASAKEPRDLRHRRIPGFQPARLVNVRMREVPLAVVMVMLTTLTLWSLGQAIVQETTTGVAPPAVASRP
jgi:hypothetical protein